MKVGVGLGVLLFAAVVTVHSRTGALFAVPARVGQGITVASLNLARATDVEEIVSELRQQGLVPAADVLLFQEVAKTESGDVGEAVGKQLGYSAVAIPSDASAPNQGLTILSRAPLEDVRVIPLKRFDLKFHSRVRFAVGAVTRIGEESVRVWNVHLDTRINPQERVTQLEPVLAEVRGQDGATVVAGDFNTVDFQWFFNVIPLGKRGAQGVAVRRRMEGVGFAPALTDEQVTYPFLNQHLDWIFTRGLTSEGSGVVRMDVSDHHAVWASLGR
jgi:endonuclease/exonuclease/phosphatase family metal-dependent hydrolase